MVARVLAQLQDVSVVTQGDGHVAHDGAGTAGEDQAAIWSITFGEAWERDRFWDWLKWQRPRFNDFVEILDASDATTLRSRLLREMLETEQAARKNKLATTGRRPLRFWCGEVA